jgi:hypothetical protein
MMSWLPWGERMRVIFAVALLLGHSGSASAEQRADALRAFDTLCVATTLDRVRFVANVGLQKSRPIPADQLRAMNDAELGYYVQVGETTFIASYGIKRDADGTLSRNCTVVTTKMSLQDARKIIEGNYKVRLGSQERQGLSTLVMYAADLAGYVTKTFIVIQHSGDADNTTSFSILDF